GLLPVTPETGCGPDRGVRRHGDLADVPQDPHAPRMGAPLPRRVDVEPADLHDRHAGAGGGVEPCGGPPPGGNLGAVHRARRTGTGQPVSGPRRSRSSLNHPPTTPHPSTRTLLTA